MRLFSLLRTYSTLIADRLIALAGAGGGGGVGPPVLTSFRLTQQPGPTIAGVAHPLQPVLVTLDQNGAPISSTITFIATIQSGVGASILAGATKQATSGTAAYTNLTPDIAATGPIVYRFTSASLPGVFVDSDPVVITKPVIVVPPDPDTAPLPPVDDTVPDAGPGTPVDQVSEVSICNLALAFLGNTDGIASFDEGSTAARACRQVYALARDETLRAFPWPFATSDDALALVEERNSHAWRFSYRYPSDVLAIWAIVPENGVITPTRTTTVAYKVGRDHTGQLIFTAQPDAFAQLTYRVTDPMQYPPEFVLALGYKIAAMIAPQVTGGDPNKLGLRALQMYEQTIHHAMALALNQTANPDEGESEFINVRN
jgi:hypothetical protein